MSIRTWCVAAAAVAAATCVTPADAGAVAHRLVVTGTRSATRTVRIGGTTQLDPDRVTIKGGGDALVVYLAGSGQARAGVLAYRFDRARSWSDVVPLGSRSSLPPGTYRLTLVTNAPVEVTFPLSGSRDLRLAPRGKEAGHVETWRASTATDGPRHSFRTAVTGAGGKLVAIGLQHSAMGAAAVHTAACLTVPGSVCRAGGVRPVGGTHATPGDGTTAAAAVYEPGDVTDGDYDAVVEAVDAGGAGTTVAFAVVVTPF